MMNKSQYAVVGCPVRHSLSPVIHQLFAEQTAIQLSYNKIEAADEHFESCVHQFFQQGGRGLNITSPYKQRAFSMSAKVTPRATRAQAANTLWQENELLCADNTDGIGLTRDLKRHTTLIEKNILLLGAGGAARGILGSLLEAKPQSLTLANRTLETALKLHEEFTEIDHVCGLSELSNDYDVIINTTSASLKQESLNLPEKIFVAPPFCYDISYNIHQDTLFVAQAKNQGCFAVDGLGMLIEQAAEAFYLWHGKMPETMAVHEMLNRRRTLCLKSQFRSL